MKLTNYLTEIKRGKKLKQHKLSFNSSAIGHDLFPFFKTVINTVCVQGHAKRGQIKAGLT